MEEYPKHFRKAIRGTVAGRMLDKRGDKEEFILIGDPYSSEADQDEIIVSIYDADGEEYFKKSNKATIQNGYLIQVADYELSLDEVNAVSDGYLRDLLKQPLSKMKGRVEQFTSPVPVHRMLEVAKDENKPVKTVQFLEKALSQLEDKPVEIPEKLGR